MRIHVRRYQDRGLLHELDEAYEQLPREKTSVRKTIAIGESYHDRTSESAGWLSRFVASARRRAIFGSHGPWRTEEWEGGLRELAKENAH